MTSSGRIRFIFATILLDALGVGVIIPTLPDVIRRFSNDVVFVNTYYGYFMASYALMQFLASPVLGSLSDRFGRRPVLLVSLLGAGLDYLLMAFAPNLVILFIGRIISGLTGASMTVASSYMADISDDSNRSANFGLIGAGWGLGFIAGPVIGGLVGSHYGASFVFILAAVLNLLNFAFGIFVLPESLPESARRKVDLKRMNPFLSLAKVLKPSPVLLLIVVFALFQLSGQVHPAIWTLYTEYKLGWTPYQVGLSLSFVGVMVALVQGGLTRIVTPKFGEQKTSMGGLFILALGFISYAMVTEGWMVYATVAVSSVGWIAGPAIQSLISRSVPSAEQGELQGSLMSLISLMSIFGPLIYTGLFAHFTASGNTLLPGAPYWAASFICFIGLGFMAFSHRPKLHDLHMNGSAVEKGHEA